MGENSSKRENWKEDVKKRVGGNGPALLERGCPGHRGGDRTAAVELAWRALKTSQMELPADQEPHCWAVCAPRPSQHHSQQPRHAGKPSVLRQMNGYRKRGALMPWNTPRVGKEGNPATDSPDDNQLCDINQSARTNNTGFHSRRHLKVSKLQERGEAWWCGG